MKYKHHAPSTTSLDSENDDDYDQKQLYNSPAVVSPAQWTRLPVITRPPQNAPISRLPPEVVIQVFKHLHSPRDIYSALRVSRTWCECSVELLWHKPSLTKLDTLNKLVKLLSDTDQTFTYASFIRRLNLLVLAKEITDDVLTVFGRCERLERLTLVNCQSVSAQTLAQVLPNFSNLVAIDLNGVLSATDSAIIGLASSAKRLQGINLSGCSNVSDQGVMALANHCPLLRRVKLSGLALLTDAPICALAQSCPLLLEIDLNHCQLITDIAVREIWLHSTSMREMRLSHCPELTDAAFPAPIRKDVPIQPDIPNPFPTTSNSDELPPLVLKKSFEHLRMLDLTACSLVTDDAIEGIIHHAAKIRNLVLSKCTLLTDRSVETICRVGRHLHYLHLGHASKITDRSVRTLARSCTRLRYVDFANCVLLTDMSVFELAALPKLRRVGLVRVNNLTDEAIYALAERHATLERIHLSYCDQISVMAIHFLLQKLHKLTHLSLTGVPAFRQPELQRFCREPPPDFNATQQLAFCVYSGKGVSQLRAFLTELFDHITEMNGTDDTEYEDDDCEPFQEDETPEPEPDLMAEDDEDYGGRYIDLPGVARRRHRGYQSSEQDLTIRDGLSASGLDVHSNSTAANLQSAANRLNAQLLAASNQGAGSSSRRARTAAANIRSLADLIPIVETSNSPPPSDVASNLSAGTGRSNGATFFRTYQDGIPPRQSGTLTPDLNFAEIGHGRGAVAGPGGGSSGGHHHHRHHLRRGQEYTPHHRPPFIEVDSTGVPSPQVSTSQLPSSANLAGTSDSAKYQSMTSAESTTSGGVVWPYREGVAWPHREPASPTINDTPRLSSETPDNRGRSVRRSLRNTLNAAEHFLFRRSPTRSGEEAGPSSNTTTATTKTR